MIEDGRSEAVRDEVDRLVQAWRRERPELDVAPMEVLSRVTRLARHLERARSAAFAAHGLEIWEFDVLAALRRAGRSARMSPGQLIKETMVTSGTMTNRVDRLAARGLVLREGHPDDRRVVLVRLTDTGREAVDAALADLMEAERRILAGLPEERYALLAAALRQLLIPYDDAAAASVSRAGGSRG
ncbi:MAG TPA: MarR family transcriptional regulator [Microlunatus sp.]